ncbi:hypothetical protein LQR31_23070, partial [Chromobacterium vaccinii]|uniref:hypothetical protein n=1 Tax=Chromobacterium vaccinii TaxID=1108595 RepID=UPI001E39EB49
MTITYVGQGEVMPDDVGNFTTEIYGTVRITGRVVGDLSAYGSATPQLNLAISMHRLVGKALPVISAPTVVQADGSFTYSEVLAIGSIRGNVGRGSRPKETYFDVGYSAQLSKSTSTGAVQNFPWSAGSGLMSLNSSGSVSLNFQTGFKQLHFKDQPSDV